MDLKQSQQGFTGIKNIIEYTSKVEEIIKGFDKETIIAFRGESKDFEETKLVPSIFRNYSSDIIQSAENMMLESVSDLKITEETKKFKRAIDAQHYAAMSRLLDISFNALTALYFAVALESKENSFVYVFGIPKFMAFSPNSEYLDTLFNKIVDDEKYEAIPQNIKLVLHSMANERLICQDGGFIFFPGRSACTISEIYYKKIEIDFNSRLEILKNLEIMYNITERKLFPEKHKSGERVRNHMNMRTHTSWNDCNEVKMYVEKSIFEFKTLKSMGVSKHEIRRILRCREEVIKMHCKTNTNEASESIEKLKFEVEIL